MSLYKEELQDDSDTLIRHRAAASNQDVITLLKSMVDETVTAVERVCGVVGRRQEVDAWKSFVTQYVAFHYMSPRYRISEIV